MILNKTGNVFTSNGAHITVSDMDTYVEIPQISSGPNARTKSGMIQLDYNNNVDFDTHLNFASLTYYVGMAIYINYINEGYQSFFSMFITLRSSTSTPYEALWACYIDSGSSTTNFYSYFYGTSSYEGKYISIPVTFYGWQYIAFYIKNTSSGVIYHYVSKFNIYLIESKKPNFFEFNFTS